MKPKIGYKLIKEEIEERITDLMLTKSAVSKYVTVTNTGHADPCWLNNRINPNRDTLATEGEVEILARLLQTDPDAIGIKQIKKPVDAENKVSLQEPGSIESRLEAITGELRGLSFLLMRILKELEGDDK